MKNTPFKPAWWLPGPHLQTLWPTISGRGNRPLELKRERVELDDGDFIDLDWTNHNKGPIVLILHGLEGSSSSPYAKGMLQTITQHGWRSCVMHFRGCSGEPNRLPSRTYHSGETTDIDFIIKLLREREPNVPIAALGFSLGGNVLLKYLGEKKSDTPLQAAVAVSVPFVLDKCATRLQSGFSRFYQWHLLKCLREKISLKYQEQRPTFLLPAVKSLQTIREFDEKITAPMHGFRNADDYYSRSSSRQFLSSITVPTLLLQAKDDPFMVEEVIPNPEELSSSVQLEVTEGGGHVGFVAGNLPWKPNYWLEERVPLFLEDFFR